jgi:hypothetical protein
LYTDAELSANDGFSDVQELFLGTNPVGAESHLKRPLLADPNTDSDHDGLTGYRGAVRKLWREWRQGCG